jgi:ribosomal protein L21E
MSKVIAKQIDNILRGDKFIRHKKNAKGNTAIYSRNHPTAKFVRVVVDSGIDLNSGKASNQVGVKLVYINRAKSWRIITTEIFATAQKLASTITAQEAAEKFVKSCKFCKAKKFKAKTGNEVCANACWTAWAGKKKAASPKKKSSQKITASTVKKAAKNPRRKAVKKSSQKKGRRNLQRFTQKILPGDLVTIEEYQGQKVTTDYTGTVLGIVQKVENRAVTVVWTANTAQVPEWLLPVSNEYEANALKSYRFKVLSRKAEWVKVA